MQPSKESSPGDKPVIGILSSILVVESGMFPGLERSYVNHDYVDAIATAGGIPLLVPVVDDETTTRRQVESVDAILLTGGYDPNPLAYGEEPDRAIDFIFPEIDEHQLRAIRIADALGKPMLGICRGLQMINIAFGGTLYQDLTLIPDSRIQHFQKSRRHSAGHSVAIAAGTVLSEVFGEAVIRTNSFHHLAVKDLAPGFVVSARAPDGVVEGIERSAGGLVLGVQWHPEMMFERHSAMIGLFDRFVAAAKARLEA